MSGGRAEGMTPQGGVEGAEKQETPTLKFREAPLSPDPPSRRLWRSHVSRAPYGPNSAGSTFFEVSGTTSSARRGPATVTSDAAGSAPWLPGAADRRR